MKVNTKITGFKTRVKLQRHIDKYYPLVRVLSFGYNTKGKHFCVLNGNMKPYKYYSLDVRGIMVKFHTFEKAIKYHKGFPSDTYKVNKL